MAELKPVCDVSDSEEETAVEDRFDFIRLTACSLRNDVF